MLKDNYVELQRASNELDKYHNEGKKDKLIEYLMGLNINIIKDIHVILHIGKNELNNCVHKPFELYKKTMLTFDALRGWQEKEVEVNKIVECEASYAHFKNGLEILELI